MALLQTSKCTSWKPAFATRTHVNVRHIRERPVIPASKGQLYNSGEEWAYSQPVLPDVGGLGGSFLDRASRKGSLLETNNTASTASLAWVELMHWILFFTAIWVSYRMFTHFTALGTAMSFYTFMLCSFGLVQALGPGAMTMHEYEGWQLSKFKEPMPGAAAAAQQPAFLEQYNNQWLRQVVYRYLMLMNISGMMMFNLGILQVLYGSGTWTAISTGMCAATLAVMLLGNKRAAKDGAGTPLPSWMNLFVIVHGLLHVAAFAAWSTAGPHATTVLSSTAEPSTALVVLQQVVAMAIGLGMSLGLLFMFFNKGTWEYGQHQALVLASVGFAWPSLLIGLGWVARAHEALPLVFWVPPVLMLLGGVLEAFFAERLADQWMHAAAVFWMLCGYVSIPVLFL